MRKKMQRSAVLSILALGVMLTASAVGAEQEVEGGRTPQLWVDEEEALKNQPSLKANFDGNGFADLAVGAPWKDANSGTVDGAGAFSAFYWDGNDFVPSSATYWEQNVGGNLREADDHFGEVLAVGDFDGDGVHDVAIGVPHEDWGADENVGAVHVFYGAHGSGLTTSGTQLLTQDVGAIPGMVEEGDLFGAALAAGDFDNDGYDDLAVGVPYEDVAGVSNAGSINIIFGSATGLNANDTQDWLKGDVSGTAETDDHFGKVLASGDFDGDGYDDLACGTPADDLVTISNSGSVDILFGSSGGLTTRLSNDHWHQDRSGMPGAAEEYDGFGAALAVGDFDDDGYDDLAIGVPYEDVGNPVIDNAGYVHVLYGSSVGLTATGTDAFNQGGGDTTNTAEDEDRFGYSLAAGDLDGDGYDDLVVGVPYEDQTAPPDVIVDTGMIHVFSGSSTGLDDHDDSLFQNNLAFNGISEDYDEFGRSLAVSDFNGDGYGDIAVGVPMEDVGTATNKGWVVLLFGTSGYVSTDNHIVYQESGFSGATGEDNDRFGWAVAAIPFDPPPEGLIFADGFESGGTGAWTDIVP